MRILWISASIFDEREEFQSGVWQKALAIKLAQSKALVLGNIAPTNDIAEIKKKPFHNIEQWGLPKDKIDNNGYPSNTTMERFSWVLNEFNPDIIQIWGSENFLKLLPFDSKYNVVKVLTIQGVLGSIASNLLLGLSYRDIISTIGLREIITMNNLLSIKKSFVADGKIEKEMVMRSNFIITQSDWTDSQIGYLNPNAKRYRTHRALRNQFISCEKWLNFKHFSPIIYSASIGYSLKGLHILIRALILVKKQFPNVELRLAGAVGRKDFLGDGYYLYILRLIKNNNLERNVTFLGAITANEIVENLQKSSVFVNPSFVESYSMAFAEAMSVGTPSVISFAGAMPELADNNKEALFYSPGDFKRCAYLICKLLSNSELSKFISENAVKRSDERNVKFDIVDEQIKIYEDILQNIKLA